MLEGGDFDDGLRDAFNDGFSQLYDNIRDFLVLHFRTVRVATPKIGAVPATC